MFNFLKKLGPGILFAGAAIGVSHLVQSTKAGADFGFGLVWALLLVNLFKFPFFQYGPKYANATGESLLEGYKKLGANILYFYVIISLATMFTIQTAVTIVTAGIASSLTNNIISVEQWTIIILIVCSVLLYFGKYKMLDKMIKIVISILALSTILATYLAFNNFSYDFNLSQVLPKNNVEIAFLIAFMGWMPAPLDISVWHSIWTIEKNKSDGIQEMKTTLFDFNVGYFGTIILGISFVLLGYFVMNGSNLSFSSSATTFATQLIEMYTSTFGSWSYIIIGLATFTTMFSTTITTLDASPRAMHKATELISNKKIKNGYIYWLFFLVIGTITIFFNFNSEMGTLVKVATIVSFITAPFYAIINYILISSSHTPKKYRPSTFMHILSTIGIFFLLGFGIWYLSTLGLFI
ncbi:Nramp family divalent metal transporter [Flavobacteriaceae bacterium]|jgi:Mn2+/Fe2+ NRAMP family transporter|nr:Nramp family divalent metal transporter [Flavobacteriaceae bacterium]MDC1372285.1 Nramp family divalent metal transporter [Flavobacteriaceae bacterium]